MENNNKLSSGKAWALFIIAMVVVFGLGLLTSALMERRAEVASIFNNRKAPFTGEKIHAQNEDFRTDFPREYDTWRQTLETNYDSKPLDVNNPNREGVVPQMYHNGNEATDVLAYRPNMVVLWAGYAFSWDYTTPRGHMHTVEDMTRTLRTGAPDTETTGSNQPGTCWTCKSPDVPRIMSEKGVAEYYKANWAMWGTATKSPTLWDAPTAMIPNLWTSVSAVLPSSKLTNVRDATSPRLLNRRCVHWSAASATSNTTSRTTRTLLSTTSILLSHGTRVLPSRMPRHTTTRPAITTISMLSQRLPLSRPNTQASRPASRVSMDSVA